MTRTERIRRTLTVGAVVASVAVAVVLSLASAPEAAPAISRSFVHARGKVWVDKKVPYSQSRYATVEGKRLSTATVNPQRLGYRTDCSGFVSLSLNLRTLSGYPYSLDTAGLGRRLTRISKADLQRGDIILRPKDAIVNGKQVPYGHSVVFLRWTDSSQTAYVGYHQSSSAKGAVRQTIRWGTSGFGTSPGFAPYRYVAVRDRVRN